jgi:hypothetical protein
MTETKIWINGIDRTSDTTGLTDDFQVEYTLNSETKTVNKAISNTLTFKGDTYLYLKSIFIDAEDGQDAIVDVLIEVQCCSKEYNFVINSELITHCPGTCPTIESKLITQDKRSLFYDILASNVWFTSYGGIEFTTGLTFYRIFYGTDNATQLIINAIIIVFGAVIINAFTILTLIVNLINQLPFDDINLPDLPTFQDLLDSMVGGSNYHTAVLIRDIFERNTLQAGGSFSSSIFQSGTYSETVLHCALTEGRDRNENPGDTNFLDTDSLHILTPIQLAELLKPVFNLDYRILSDANGNVVLKMERKDYFDASLITLVNMDDQVREGNADAPCYTYFKKEVPAYSRYSYADDSLDIEGNRMLRTNLSENSNKVSYFDLVEHNPGGVYKNRKGERTVTNQFAAARFQDDIKSRSIPDGIRQLRGQQKMLVLERGTTSNMKLLILSPFTPPLDAKVISRPSASESGKEDYNWPLNFSENYEENELIQNFHYIDHPGFQEGVKFVIDEWTWHPSNFCEIVDIIDTNGIDLLLENDEGYAGKPDSITVRFGSSSIVFKGIKMKKI